MWGCRSTLIAPCSEDNERDPKYCGNWKKVLFFSLWHFSFFSCAQVKVWRRLSSPAQWLQKKREHSRLGCKDWQSAAFLFSFLCWCCSNMSFHFRFFLPAGVLAEWMGVKWQENCSRRASTVKGDAHSLWWAGGFSLLSPSSSALSCRSGRSQSCQVCRTFWLQKRRRDFKWSHSYGSDVSPYIFNLVKQLGLKGVATPCAARLTWTPVSGGFLPHTLCLAVCSNMKLTCACLQPSVCSFLCPCLHPVWGWALFSPSASAPPLCIHPCSTVDGGVSPQAPPQYRFYTD